MKVQVLKLLVLLSFTAILGCDKDKHSDETGTLELNVKVRYGDLPLEMLKKYPYGTDQDIVFNRFSMYMDEIALHGGASHNHSDLGIKYLDLTQSHASAALAEKGYTLTLSDIPVDEYSRFEFGLGINAANNAKAPSDYAAGHPLASAAEYWSSWKSYIFTKTEGQLDEDKDGAYDVEFALHLGGDEAYRLLQLKKPVSIKSGQTTKMNLEIDLKEMLMPAGGTKWDLVKYPVTHSLQYKPQISELTDRLVKAFTVVE